MHLPWTQVANEVIDQAAPQLASALEWHEDMEVGEALALRGLLCFIRWTVGRCPTDRPPSQSALIPGLGAARLIALQMRYRGDAQALVEAMAAVRPSPIITISPEGIRVNGLDRYDQAWRKNFKDEAKLWDERAKVVPSPPPALRAYSGRKPDGELPESARQTQTQIDVEKKPPRAGARAESPQADRPSPPPAPTPAPPPAAPEQRQLLEEPPLVDAMDGIHRAARGRPLEWGRPRDRVAHERALGDLAAEHGAAEVLRRLRNALTYPPGRFPHFDEVGDLPKHWARYAEAWAEQGTGPPRQHPRAHQGMGSNPPEAPEVAEQRLREQRDRLRRQHPEAAKVLDLAAARAARAPPATREDALILRAVRLLPFGERRRVYAERRRLTGEQVPRDMSPRALRMARRFHLAQALATALKVQAHELQSIPKVGGT